MGPPRDRPPSDPPTEGRTAPDTGAGAARTLTGPSVPPTLAGMLGVPGASEPLSPGVLVGRYVIVQSIGAGGMGAVALAYDTKLERKVAIKTLLASSAGPNEQARMLHEAQAMARLSHPNVAAIYDVGVHEGGIFLAMEYIEGVTFRAWLEKKPPRREILAVLKKAGRGLVAAHKAGLVHRDFKPSNVVVARDGRVCVVDFGIAHAGKATDPDRGASLDGVVTEDRSSTGGSFGGAVAVGSLGYMAPEQIGSNPVDQRADVFGFSVTAWRALFGVPPFPVNSLDDYARAVRERGPSRPKNADVPRWLEAILRRGMQPDPRQRYATIEEVLGALDSDPSRSRILTLGAGLLALAVAAGFGARERRAAAVRSACEAEGGAVGEAWLAKKDAVTAAARAAPDPLAGARADRAIELIEGYAAAWHDQQAGSCVAARLERTETERVHTMRSDCLLRGRQQFETAIEILAGADAKTSRQILELLRKLPKPSQCTAKDAEATYAPLPSDAEAQRLAHQARSALARATVQQYVGHVRDALDEGHRAEEAARAAHDAATEAGALLLCGSIDTGVREDDAHGLPELASAIAVSESIGDERVGCIGAARMAFSIATRAHKPDLARPWLELARAKLGRLGADSEAEYALLLAEGTVATQEGDLKRAEEVRLRSLDVTRRAYGDDAPRTCFQIANLGLAYVSEGELLKAEPQMREAVGCVERGDGRFSGSARLHWYLADALVRIGKFEEGAEEAALAAKVQEGEDPASPALSEMFANEARGWVGARRFADAERAARRGLAVAEQLHTASGEAESAYALGEARAGQGDAQGAREACARSEALHEQDDPPAPDKLYDPDALRCEAEAELRLGDAAAARAHLEKSVSLPKRAVPGDLPWARFVLARALVADAGPKDASRDPRRARELGQAALAELREAARAYPSLNARADEVERWLSGR